jgi:hypothetical protein
MTTARERFDAHFARWVSNDEIVAMLRAPAKEKSVGI